MKLIMLDLDGTLFDTKEVNYRAYKDAVEPYGYHIDYDYYCRFCNGRHYLEFLPEITTKDKNILSDIHKRKKNAYAKYLSLAKLNTTLVDIVMSCKTKCKIALVTTASRKNTEEILCEFGIKEIFDLIITQEDINKKKPDPEGYIKVMKHFDIIPEESVIFEDSDVGIEAAERSGANVYVVKGYN